MNKFLDQFRAWNTLTSAQRRALRGEMPYDRSLEKRGAFRAVQEKQHRRQEKCGGLSGDPWK